MLNAKINKDYNTILYEVEHEKSITLNNILFSNEYSFYNTSWQSIKYVIFLQSSKY